MKNVLLCGLLSGLMLASVSEAKTPAKSVQPVCAEGKLVAMFREGWCHATIKDYRYYRCQLKQDQNGYLVQDFYWPSGKKQIDPFLVSETDLRESCDFDGLVNDSIVVWYENGKKEDESQYVDGKKNWQWTRWYENGQKEMEGKYADDKKTGQWAFWYENSQKMTEGVYANDEETGQWTQWRESGEKASEG